MKRTIAIDFDGVIHNYKAGDWEGVKVVTGGVKEGAREIITRWAESDKIIIYSCRACCPDGVKAIKDALNRWRIPYDKITFEKPHAHVYIDDKAYRFKSWEATELFVQGVKA